MDLTNAVAVGLEKRAAATGARSKVDILAYYDRVSADALRNYVGAEHQERLDAVDANLALFSQAQLADMKAEGRERLLESAKGANEPYDSIVSAVAGATQYRAAADRAKAAVADMDIEGLKTERETLLQSIRAEREGLALEALHAIAAALPGAVAADFIRSKRERAEREGKDNA